MEQVIAALAIIAEELASAMTKTSQRLKDLAEIEFEEEEQVQVAPLSEEKLNGTDVEHTPRFISVDQKSYEGISIGQGPPKPKPSDDEVFDFSKSTTFDHQKASGRGRKKSAKVIEICKEIVYYLENTAEERTKEDIHDHLRQKGFTEVSGASVSGYIRTCVETNKIKADKIGRTGYYSSI